MNYRLSRSQWYLKWLEMMVGSGSIGSSNSQPDDPPRALANLRISLDFVPSLTKLSRNVPLLSRIKTPLIPVLDSPSNAFNLSFKSLNLSATLDLYLYPQLNHQTTSLAQPKATSIHSFPRLVQNHRKMAQKLIYSGQNFDYFWPNFVQIDHFCRPWITLSQAQRSFGPLPQVFRGQKRRWSGWLRAWSAMAAKVFLKLHFHPPKF